MPMYNCTHIDPNWVSILYKGNGSSNLSLGSDMSDTEAVATATEAAIGEQCNTIAKSSSHDGTCRRQHFRQTRSSRRAFVTDNNNIAALDLLVFQTSQHQLLVVVNLGRSLFC